MSDAAGGDEAAGVEREATELEDEAEERVDRLRRLAEGLAVRLGGNPAVVRLRAVLDTYDRAGGGLVASGLAYTSLLALLPGLLLGLSAIGFLVREPAVQRQIVAFIAGVLPPLEAFATTALDTVSKGTLPTGILAIVTLFWGSSRLYANLDTAFSRIFAGAPRRNPVAQTVRGVVLTVVLILVPVGLVALGTVVSWLTSLAPGGLNLSAMLETLLELASPVGSLLAFALAVALCFRFVPTEHVPWRAVALPAAVCGVALTVLTQVYVFIAPRLVGVAAVYGTALAIFGLLAWLSIAFNVLLLGAAWTELRARLGPIVTVPRRGLPGPADRAGAGRGV